MPMAWEQHHFGTWIVVHIIWILDSGVYGMFQKPPLRWTIEVDGLIQPDSTIQFDFAQLLS